MNKLLTSACIQDTASVHGINWAAKYYAKRGVNIDTVMFALFKKYSRKGTI